jgi:UDP:flavonoid glycosyltransferase YjiC (YdhE family)
MSKVIFFNIPATGHVNPSIPLVKELVTRGERVIYYCTETYRAKIESTGAEFRMQI